MPELLRYYAFDLLHLDGRDLRELPLLERKQRLEQLLAPLPPDHPVRFSDHLIGAGPELYRQACRLGAEGIVAKRMDAPYRSGRHEDWLKVKCHARQEFVIGGYTTVKGSGIGLGSLLLGVHRDGALTYVGRVGTGWDARTGQALRDALDPLRVDQPPFVRLPSAAQGAVPAGCGRSWWPRCGSRPGPPTACCATPASRGCARTSRPPASSGSGQPATGPQGRGLAGRSSCTGCGSAMRTARCWTGPPLTKGDVARYYAAMADLVLPYVAGRPLSVVRCPERLGEGCFYQRHLAAGMPPAVRTVLAAGRDGKEPYLAIDDARGLMALVQFGAVELHPNGARPTGPSARTAWCSTSTRPKGCRSLA